MVTRYDNRIGRWACEVQCVADVDQIVVTSTHSSSESISPGETQTQAYKQHASDIESANESVIVTPCATSTMGWNYCCLKISIKIFLHLNSSKKLSISLGGLRAKAF